MLSALQLEIFILQPYEKSVYCMVVIMFVSSYTAPKHYFIRQLNATNHIFKMIKTRNVCFNTGRVHDVNMAVLGFGEKKSILSTL